MRIQDLRQPLDHVPPHLFHLSAPELHCPFSVSVFPKDDEVLETRVGSGQSKVLLTPHSQLTLLDCQRGRGSSHLLRSPCRPGRRSSTSISISQCTSSNQTLQAGARASRPRSRFSPTREIRERADPAARCGRPREYQEGRDHRRGDHDTRPRRDRPAAAHHSSPSPTQSLYFSSPPRVFQSESMVSFELMPPRGLKTMTIRRRLGSYTAMRSS